MPLSRALARQILHYAARQTNIRAQAVPTRRLLHSLATNYGFFSKLKGIAEAEVLAENDKTPSKSLLDDLSESQQDLVLELNKYFRKDTESPGSIASVKKSFISFLSLLDPKSVSPKVIEFVFEYLDRLKYEIHAPSSSKEVKREDPMLLNEIFDEAELLTIYKTISYCVHHQGLELLEGKAASLVYPEMAAVLSRSDKLTDQNLWTVRVLFCTYLLHKKFNSAAIDMVSKFLQRLPRSSAVVRSAPLDLLEVLKLTNTHDLNALEQFFSALSANLVQISDESLSKWVEFIVGTCLARIQASALDRKYTKTSDAEDTLRDFTKRVLKFNRFAVNLTLLRKLSVGDDINNISIVLQEILDDIRTNKCPDKFSLETILSASVKANYQSETADKLLSSYRAHHNVEDIDKETWDAIFSYEVLKSPGESLSENSELVDTIKQVSSLQKAAKDIKPHEVNGELVFDALSFTDDSTSFIDTATVNRMLEAGARSQKLASFLLSISDTLQVPMDIGAYSILIRYAMAIGDRDQTLDFFQKSIDAGLFWLDATNAEQGNILGEGIQFMFLEVTTREELGRAFKFLTKAHNFISFLDVNTTASILEVLLSFDLVGDALSLIESEFVLSKDTSASLYFGKVNEEDLFDLESPTLNARKIDLHGSDAHRIYLALWKYLQKATDHEICFIIYSTIHQCFSNVPQEMFLESMRKFNLLHRPDIAVRIFQHMKKLNRLFGLPPPSKEHYTYLFKEFGNLGYETGVSELHAMLRLDVSVDQDIHLRNALLGAYADLQDVIRTRDLFELYMAISTKSKNAVNLETVNIMLKAYTYYGLEHTNRFWNSLTELNYIPDASNYRQLAVGHSYHGDWSGALQVLDEMEFNGEKVTPEDIRAVYLGAEPKVQKELARGLRGKYGSLAGLIS